MYWHKFKRSISYSEIWFSVFQSCWQSSWRNWGPGPQIRTAQAKRDATWCNVQWMSWLRMSFSWAVGDGVRSVVASGYIQYFSDVCDVVWWQHSRSNFGKCLSSQGNSTVSFQTIIDYPIPCDEHTHQEATCVLCLVASEDSTRGPIREAKYLAPSSPMRLYLPWKSMEYNGQSYHTSCPKCKWYW